MNDDFNLRACTKKELAVRYFPDTADPHTAVNHLMAWIRQCTPLWEALQQNNYRNHSHWFTSEQVRLIIDHLGPP